MIEVEATNQLRLVLIKTRRSGDAYPDFQSVIQTLRL